jgi:MFS family permease
LHRSLGFGLLLSVMDTSIIATALVTISQDFDGFNKSNWTVLAYTLTYMGKWAQRFHVMLLLKDAVYRIRYHIRAIQ